MKIILIGLLLSLSVNTVVHAQSGLITIQSSYDASTTAERLINALQEKGMTIFARVDHSQGATNVGMKLRPTEVIIFGNPKVGSPLMLCNQSVAIDLPQKALVYEEANGEVWLTYNDPKYLVERHSVSGCDETIEKIDKALANFARKATQP